MAKWEVPVRSFRHVTVEADTEIEAREKALEKIGDGQANALEPAKLED